jgi:predicted dienelactone hydrolase
LTSTLAGFHPEWRDPRIGAVLSIAGPSNFFTPTFFTHADVPFMMLAGDLDVLVPYASNAAPIPVKKPGAELATVRGGSHTGFSGGTAMLRGMKNTDAIGCWSVKRYVDADYQPEGLFGPAEIGVDYTAKNGLCEIDPLPRTINVLRQHMITTVVVAAFFEKTLSADSAVRRAAEVFLTEQAPAEIAEFSYERSAVQ